MATIRFAAHNENMSTHRGYQFKFCCDQCGSGYVTRHRVPVTSLAGIALGFLDFFGWGRFVSACWSAGEIEEHGRSGKRHDDAFAQAVEESKGHFHHCPCCDKWVCLENCWNDQAHQCGECAPDIRLELTAQKTQAMAAACERLLAQVQQLESTKGSDASAPAASGHGLAAIPEIHFCCECGGEMTEGDSCTSCGNALAAHA